MRTKRTFTLIKMRPKSFLSNLPSLRKITSAHFWTETSSGSFSKYSRRASISFLNSDLLHEHFRMTEEILMDRVFRAFDADSDSLISMKDWVVGLSIFLRGSLEEKTDCKSNKKYCSQQKCSDSFRVYDLNGDGFISREEMFQLLKNCLVKQPAEEDPDEGVKELVEITLKKMVQKFLKTLFFSFFY